MNAENYSRNVVYNVYKRNKYMYVYVHKEQLLQEISRHSDEVNDVLNEVCKRSRA